MTFQEAHKNGKGGLVTRRGLSHDELICDCWTNGKIAITLMGSKENPRFIVIADGNYMKLIEP